MQDVQVTGNGAGEGEPVILCALPQLQLEPVCVRYQCRLQSPDGQARGNTASSSRINCSFCETPISRGSDL